MVVTYRLSLKLPLSGLDLHEPISTGAESQTELAINTKTTTDTADTANALIVIFS